MVLYSIGGVLYGILLPGSVHPGNLLYEGVL